MSDVQLHTEAAAAALGEIAVLLSAHTLLPFLLCFPRPLDRGVIHVCSILLSCHQTSETAITDAVDRAVGQ